MNESEDPIASGVCLELVWCLIFNQGVTFPVNEDYFQPPMKRIIYWSPFPKLTSSPHIVFINCKFEIYGIPNVKTKEEYDEESKNGALFVKFGNEDNFKIEPPMFHIKVEEYDIFDIRRIICMLEITNIDWIKELMYNKIKYG